MDPERFRQIENLFHSALECDPARRSAFLDAACLSDSALRREVESLLASYEKEGFTEAPAFAEALQILDEREAPSLTGQQIGPYKVIREIGHGGMGTVYLASRADQAFEKQVAIKLIKRGHDTDDVIRRFHAERQILANLEHPNITRLLDGGSTQDGLPYFVMDYIQGEPLDEYCDARKLNLPARLKLFQQICSAVHYAHQNLVVHRDIKAGNILVTPDGIPRLLDFGIAKLLVSDPSSPDPTMTVVRRLTPESASPEQVRGGTITTASDIYSLGVLLYKLLSGRSPYHLGGRRPEEIERAICEETPERPSVAIDRVESINAPGALTPQSVSAARDTTPEKLRRSLQGDLDNIVLMALRKEPERRYSSVEQLSEDLRRHLEGLPVQAHPDTWRYRAGKFVRRRRATVAAAALIVISLLGGIAATSWQARVARSERDRARLQQAKADRINAFLQDMLGFSDTRSGSPNIKKGHDATLADMLDVAGPRAEKELEDQPAVKAEMLRTIGRAYTIQPRFDLAERYLREALDTDLKVYGPDDQETARTTYLLGVALGSKGDYAGAVDDFRRAVAVYRKQPKDTNLQVADFAEALNSFGVVLLRVYGQFQEAESAWSEVLAFAPRLTGKDRSQVASAENFLAALHSDRGEYREAESWGRKSVAEYRSLGNERFQIAESEVNLGAILRTEGQYPEAEQLIQDGLAIYRQLLGEQHPSVAYAWVHLGTVHYLEGKYAEAQEEATRAAKIYEATLPKGHGAVTSAHTLQGLVLNKTGHASQAEPILRDSLQTRLRVLPKGHYLTAITQGALGECLTLQKRYAEAEPLLQESYGVLKSVHGEHSPLTQESMRRLALLYNAWGKPEKAVPYQTAEDRSSAPR